MTNKKLVIDIQSGETYEEDLSQETISFHKKINEQIKKAEAEAQTKATAKAALLSKLGITAEEAALLLS